MKNILITGGCGFIGSNLAIALKSDGHEITCFDNLSRKGSEILLNRIQEHGCKFIRGDVRYTDDFDQLEEQYDIMIECSAEPSVMVGAKGEDAKYLLDNNLIGSLNCFEFCRKKNIAIIFLSTSRVYPYDLINNLKFEELSTRYEYSDNVQGISKNGVSLECPLNGYRSLYGASKLASEFVLQEYSLNYSIPAIINRLGVIAGPWQLGKADQGVFTFWMASHYYKRNMNYIGFGGKGKQVRDVLHIDDLSDLITLQINNIDKYRGQVFNAGGSLRSNLSLVESTEICQEITGNKITIDSELVNRPFDVIWYLTDNGITESEFSWKPTRSSNTIMKDIYDWIEENDLLFQKVLNG